jgi:hypothetical protein
MGSGLAPHGDRALGQANNQAARRPLNLERQLSAFRSSSGRSPSFPAPVHRF